MNLNKFKELTKGHFFTVVFKKLKTGELRTMNAHPMTKCYIKGTGKPVTDGRAVVWDRQVFRKNLKDGMSRKEAGAKSYRSFYPDQIIELRVGGKKYDSEGKEID